MKKISFILLLSSLAFAIQPCDNGVDACAYEYKTPLAKELIIINMRHKPIIFSVGGSLGGKSKAVYNRILQPYQRYTLLSKRYEKMEDNKETLSWQFKVENYIANQKQDLELRYPY